MYGLRLFLPAALVILAISFIAPPQVAGQPYQRAITIPIKVILIGLSGVNTNYLSWTHQSSGNLPSQVTNQVLLGNGTGEFFYPQYMVVQAPASFQEELDSYLQSIQRDVQGPDPWFGTYVTDSVNSAYCDWKNFSIPYVVYDAYSVESWLWAHSQELGGFPSNGWTVIVSYLPELPSVTWQDVEHFEATRFQPAPTLPTSKPHYYGIVSIDRDLGYQSRYRDFMDAWGGRLGRMWYVDLSAGPVYNSQWEDIPLQVALGDNHIDLSSTFGQKWLTEYVSDYVSQATINLITPDFAYLPVYRPNYQIDIYVMDNRTAAEKATVPIQSTINVQDIQSAFDGLVPYSKVTINVNYTDISSNLAALVEGGYKYTDSWIQGSLFCSPERFGVVDARPVYDYLTANITSYEKNPYLTPATMTIPVFAFAFSSLAWFSYTYKWFIGGGAFEGVALDHLALISLNQYEFTYGDHVTPLQPGKGLGFTQDIIHEVGHEFGLEHPHQFGNVGDFVFSPMGYFTGDIQFGIIDRDAVQRAHVDEVYAATENIMATLSSSAAAQVQAKLAAADSAYGDMNYTNAMQAVLGAYQLAQQLHGTAPMIQSSTTMQTLPPITPAIVTATAVSIVTVSSQSVTLYVVAGALIGLVVGIAVATILFKKGRRES